MNKITRLLAPASRRAAFFHGRPHHVNLVQHRASAFRCIHSGANGETDGSPGGKGIETSKVEGEGEGETDVLDESNAPRLKPEEGIHPVDLELQRHLENAQRLRRRKNEKWAERKEKKYQKRGGLGRGKVEGFPARPSISGHEEGGGTLVDHSKSTHVQNSGVEHPTEAAPKYVKQRSCTIEYEFPEEATKDGLLKILKVDRLNAKHWNLWSEKGHAIVVLFTPGLAALVENDASFVPDLLETISRSSERRDQKSFEADVVLACVDGLSPGIESLASSRGRPLKEGFSILHGLQEETLPSLWSDSEAPLSKSPSTQSSITIREGSSGQPELTLPLANTLFKNGRLSTLLVSKWQCNASEKAIAIQGPVQKTNVIVNMLQDMHRGLPEAYIPAIPLTPARPIVNGLGNIVRTINFGGEEVSEPASRELESTVTKYLHLKGWGNRTIDVWALVIPPESATESANLEVPATELSLPRSIPVTAEEVQSKWGSLVDFSEESTYVAHWIKARKAKFCRVLSGGGGWGAKQGLLSLDPQTTYDEVPEARFDFSGGSMEDQQASALGNIAQEGALIQFFVARRGRPQKHTELKKDYKLKMRRSAVFGAVPSTIDEIPSSKTKSNGAATGQRRSTYLRRGHFGFVSESGMFVRHGSDHTSSEQSPTADSFTKVDLPYSYFYTDYGQQPKEPMIRQVGTGPKEGFTVRKVTTDRVFTTYRTATSLHFRKDSK